MAEDKKRTLVIKIGCLLAAIVLWLYVSNESNTIQSRTIKNIPIRIINEDTLKESSLILSPNQEITINLKISGTPSKIFSVDVDDFDLIADLSGYILKKGSQKIPVEILDSPNELNILNDTSLWADIEIDKLVEKTLPIVVNSSGDVGEGFYEFDSIIEPKNITVSGAADYIDKVDKISLEIDKADATSDMILTLPVKALDGVGDEVTEVQLEPLMVEVLIPVKKTKEVEISVKTEGNIKTGFILKGILPQKDSIIIAGNENIVKNITSIETETINLNEISQESGTISVKLQIPEGITLIEDRSSVNVDVELEKVEEENFNIQLQTKNLKDGFKVDVASTEVSVILIGAESIINNIKEEEIVGYMDFTNLVEGEYDVPIKFELPEGVSLVSQNNRFVKAVLTKADEQTTNSEEQVNQVNNAEESLNTEVEQ